jgi:serine/threonine-protein kinase
MSLDNEPTLDDSTLPREGPPVTLRPGQGRRFGDYEILSELGRGGMGVVYLARHVELQRQVALKMILTGQLASGDDVIRFQTEARAAAALNHPGIVPIHEVGQRDGCHFFSMGYVGGSNLASRTAAGPMAPDEAAAIVRAVAEAVHFAHNHGIIHRDLKPANILLDADGRPLVTDFGLAKRMPLEGTGTTVPHGLTQTGAVMGTPSYMAPEQAAGRGEQVGYRSDIYALGAILYELLTGRPPFRAASTLETLMQVVDAPPAPPRLLNGAIPSDLEAVCLKCLEKSPADRYASAKELADDLGRFLDREAVTADRGRASRLLRPWLRDSRYKDILAVHGRAWRWQGPIVFVVFLLTNILVWVDCQPFWPYLVVWITGLVLWVIPACIYVLRPRRELTLVEKQLTNLVFLSLLVSFLMLIEADLTGVGQMQFLSLWLGYLSFVIAACAVLLRGSLYLLAFLCAVSSVVVALAPAFGPLSFGLAYGIGVSIPGWKYGHTPNVAQPQDSGIQSPLSI